MVNYLATLFLCKPPRDSYAVLVPNLSPVSDNLLFMNQPKMKNFSPKECAGHEGRSADDLHTKWTHYRPSYKFI